MKAGFYNTLPVALLLVMALFLSPSQATESVRASVLAGSWYPADPQQLARLVDDYLDSAQAKGPRLHSEQPLRALILPHAGYRYSGPTAAQGISLVRGKGYRRIVILAPTHHSPFRGLSIADVEFYETPLGRIPLDQQAVQQLRHSSLMVSNDTAHQREHSIEIELPLLQQALQPGWKLIPILVGDLQAEDYSQAVEILRPLLDADTLVLASSDFTHYGARFRYQPFPVDSRIQHKIQRLDEGALQHILARDPDGFLEYKRKSGITICGYRPIALLLHLLPDTAIVEQLAYQTSGELTGDYRHSVSYLVVAVTSSQPLAGYAAAEDPSNSPDLSEEHLKRLHNIALLGVDHAGLGKAIGDNPLLNDVPEGLKRLGGAFVTLKKNGNLRGCIGYIQPRVPLYQAVFENGVNAASRDHRFLPITVEELKDLEVEVSVLTVPQPIDSIEAFEVGTHGIILKKNGHRAVFLPEVAEVNGWSREVTLSKLSLKAGLPADAWKNGTELEIFYSEKYTAPYQQQ